MPGIGLTRMPIERGKDWGTVVPPGLVDVIATTDAEVRTVVEHCWAAGKEVPPIAIIGGDLWRALGAPGGGLERIRSDEARMVPIDAAQVQLDDRSCVSVAHVFCLRSWWVGPVIAVVNSEWRDEWRVAPKAHPNDGRFDLLEGNLPIRQRWLAKNRLRTGDHLPHSGIRSERITELERTFERPLRIRIDDVDEGRHRSIALKVVPDAFFAIF